MQNMREKHQLVQLLNPKCNFIVNGPCNEKNIYKKMSFLVQILSKCDQNY